jgi:hypothetical protein
MGAGEDAAVTAATAFCIRVAFFRIKPKLFSLESQRDISFIYNLKILNAAFLFNELA